MTCHLFSIIVKNITSILIWHISVKSNLSIQSWNTLLPNHWMHIMLELFFRILVNFDRTHETICSIRCKEVLNCFFVVSTPSFSIKFSCCNFTHDNVHPWHLPSWTMMGGGGERESDQTSRVFLWSCQFSWSEWGNKCIWGTKSNNHKEGVSYHF